MKATTTAPSAAKAAAPRKPRRAAPKAADAKHPSERSSSHEQRVREAAYFIYERSGRVDGRALENWLAAEALLLEQTQAAQRDSTEG